MKPKHTKKKFPVPMPKSPHPTDWLYLNQTPVTVQNLRDHFQTMPQLDVECWPELQVLELTFPNKHYIDFEAAPLDLGDEESNQLLAAHQAKTVFYVSAEPICTEESLSCLRSVLPALGGCFVADNDAFQPLLTSSDA